MMSTHACVVEARERRGIALIAVLYFLVVSALTATAVLFAQRVARRNTLDVGNGTHLLAAADASLHLVLSAWNPADRNAQRVGSTVATTATLDGRVQTTTYVTRLTPRLFSIASEATFSGGNVARRVSLLVRLPLESARARAALISDVGVAVGQGVRLVTDSSQCDTPSTAMILAPDALLTIDAGIPPGSQPAMIRDSVAADSSIYLRIAGSWWSELAQRADIRLGADARITPTPSAVSGECSTSDANWGDPLGTLGACATRAPLVYAPGDLTIDGGTGQGVLLVDGHLMIAGPFTFSGQIVARRGIETLADNITISGVVYAWRASSDASVSHAITNDVRLTHTTTLRYSGCDARHGIASWLHPRRVRERAWSELF